MAVLAGPASPAPHALTAWGAFGSSLGFSFDLAPLTKKKDTYRVQTDQYEFHINVCGPVSMGICPPDSGACQISKRQVTALRPGCSLGCPVRADVLLQDRSAACQCPSPTRL